MRKFPQRYFFCFRPSGCCDAAAASADVAALGQLQVSCEKQERERDSLEKGAVIGKKERIRKQWRKQRQQQEMEVEQEAGSKSWLDGFRLVFVFLITHQFHLLNLRISISFLPAPPSTLSSFSHSLCVAGAAAAAAVFFGLFSTDGIFVVFSLLPLSFPSVCLFVFLLLFHSLSRAIAFSLSPPLSYPENPTIVLSFRTLLRWQNFLQNEIVFVLTISLKLNYLYYSDGIVANVKGWEREWMPTRSPPLSPPKAWRPFSSAVKQINCAFNWFRCVWEREGRHIERDRNEMGRKER